MKNLMIRLIPVLALLASFALSACEKMVLDEETTVVEQEGNVTIKASMFNIVPFDDTRAVQDIADYCTRLCFVVYKDDTQVKKVLQKAGDSGFGQVSVPLEPGTYQLLVLAHSSNGNPSLTTPEKLQFANSDGFSDTFYYYGDLEVTGDSQIREVTLQRASSLVRIIATDEAPAEAARVHLFYTGESGVFNAVTGWGGTVNSQQSVFVDIDHESPQQVLDAYTFLRNETGELKIDITVHDAVGNILSEKILDHVPLKNRMVTEYRGNLFSESVNEESFSFKAETSWEVFEQHTF